MSQYRKGYQRSDQPGSSNPNSPQYINVGSGSTSESAARLKAILDHDSSGDGESINNLLAWNPTLAEDETTPMTSPEPLSFDQQSDTPHSERPTRANAMHQVWYNHRRVALGRSINRVVEMLKSLQEMNAVWPATYPSVQLDDANAPRHGLLHTQSTAEGAAAICSPRPGILRRAQTSIRDISIGEGNNEGESSTAAEQRMAPEPRLMTPQIVQEFSVLKLDLKLGALYQAELVHSLEKNSIASLLNGKISTSIKHLLSLRERIEDTSSKVLVTGDLNAGKSTFCNALLRRKILPEDQQPCTSIFCEVLDARDNDGVEEVHAVHKDSTYDRNDESTYDVHTLHALEKLVVDNEIYTLCKIYLMDVRSIDESLLNNGVVDIAIIDAPGLNSDTTQTTALFARQEEIDVIVFIVSAANHFTQTAKEFIWAAAAEKSYIFVVVNGYDDIKDKERCQKMILEQVTSLSPQTSKESSELIHFVSSNAIPTLPPSNYPDGIGGSGSSSGEGEDGPDSDKSDPKGKGKGREDTEKLRAFQDLEQSLRRFVLEKRARSKLAPAKTYLLNILRDVHTLATVNQGVAQSELDRVAKELQHMEPALEASKKAKAEVGDDVDRKIDSTCKDIYDYTRSTLTFSIHEAAIGDLGIPYPGLLNAFKYSEDLKKAMLLQVSTSVTACEEYARMKAVNGVSSIIKLGLLHVGNEYMDLTFRSTIMFRRKRDALAKQVDIETTLWDFIDWPNIIPKQEVASTGIALTIATVMGGRMAGGYGWVDGALGVAKVVGNNNLRRLIIPGVLATIVASVLYTLNQIQHSLPRRLSTKVAAQLSKIDYVHANSDRISSTVRRVLRFPADNLRFGLQHSVEQLVFKREEIHKIRSESEVAQKYFANLIDESFRFRNAVEGINLESHTPGITAAAYDS
ncbi:transmembrane GTPase fzo1 [Bisporella sp. PMI_857]|nr:transmembrane GTPase fzo1 [Bisporella sp. PMI_857]